VSGNENIVRILVDNGSDIKRESGQYGNALNAAAFKVHAKLVWLFLDEYRANHDLADSQGRSALHLAARGGHAEIVDCLLNIGLDPNVVDKKGDSAIHYAASGASKKVIWRILQASYQDARDNFSWSPRHWACRSGDSEIVELLVEQGIKSTVVVTFEPPGIWTPHSIAMFHQNRQLSVKGNSSIHLFEPQVIPSKATECSGDTIQSHSTQGPSFIHAQKHSDFSCNGCVHVSS
jgi:ankyrin repeat protein